MLVGRSGEEKCDITSPWQQNFWISTIFYCNLHCRTMEEKYGLEKLYFLKREINISANKISLPQGQSYTERKYLLTAILRFAWTSAFKQFFLFKSFSAKSAMRMTTTRWHGVTWRFRVLSFNAFSEIFKAPKFGIGFLGLILGPGIYLNFVGSLLGLYWVMIYASIRSFPSLKVRSTPLGLSNIGGVWKGEGEVAGGGRGRGLCDR